MSAPTELTGPDLAGGIPASDLRDGAMLLGHAAGKAVLLVRRGKEVFAVSATCTHYGGPLADGLLDGETVHCPWHHARFHLRTGEAQAPALRPVACWDVETRGDRLVVLGKKPRATPPRTTPAHPGSILIVGGGAAGHSAAEVLRREGFAGKVTILSADPSPLSIGPTSRRISWRARRPRNGFRCVRRSSSRSRTSSSSSALASRRSTSRGSAPSSTVERASPTTRCSSRPARNQSGSPSPGAISPHVRSLRTLADSRAILALARTAGRAVVLGASFIGLEVAAALRTRGLEVRVVAPDARPLERVLGPALGDFVRALHEEHGVVFRLGQTATSIDAGGVTLSGGEVLAADFVVAGVGVRPAVALAEAAGLAMDRGVLVNEYLETSAPGIYAAGDIARWPDPHSGQRIRVEHWVVAQRQGELAARNMLGKQQRCALVPFFWSQHYDVGISYVGHAETWDRTLVAGSVAGRDCRVSFERKGKTVAVVTIGRDLESLRAEAAMERSTA